MELDTRLEILKLFYKNGESTTAALRAYKTLHKLHQDPFSTKAIKKMVNKFEETKSLHDAPKSGRPSLIEERKETVLNALHSLQDNNPYGHASSSAISHSIDIPKASVLRVLKACELRTFKISLHQTITLQDKPKRINFAEWVLDNSHLLDNVLWSDEAYFSLDGVVNRHNCIIWAHENPHRIITERLHSEKICVWMAFTSSYKLKPFIFEQTVNQDNYTDMLRNHAFPQIRQKRKMSSVIFQQDGAPPHYSIQARQFLTSQLPENRIVSRGVGHTWPPRSPDLSPLDYYLWGTLKARVYHAFIPRTIDDLKHKIIEEIDAISIDELQRSVNNLVIRCQLVVQQDGGLFENLL